MKNFNEDGMKSTKDLSMNNSSIFDQSDFKILDVIKLGRSNEEYLDDYLKLIDYSLLRGLNKENLQGYYEKHHILPKCMGGEDEDYNYVLLTALEHIVAHLLLFEIYPNNYGLTRAALMMISCYDSKCNTEREKVMKILKNLNEDLLNYFSEVRSTIYNTGKRVVCLDDDLSVIRVYDKINHTIKDGFYPHRVGYSCKNFPNIRCGGYLWMELSEYEKIYPENIENYYNNLSKGVQPVIENIIERRIRYNTEKQSKKIICYNETNQIVKIFNSIDEIDKNFCGGIRKNNIINNNIQFHGYYWMEFNNWSDRSDINEYYNNSPHPYPIPNRDNEKIVCLSKDGKLLKIYDKLNKCEEDGFSLITVGKAIRNKILSKGYYWDKYLNWISLSEENKLTAESYDYNADIKIIPETSEIICCDEGYNILRIYSSINDNNFIKDGINSNSITTVLGRNNHYYRGYYWYYLREFPYKNKVNEFYNLIELPKLNLEDQNFIPKLSIRGDEFGNVFRIYSNYHEGIIDNYSYKTISKVFNMNRRFSMGYNWYTIEEYIEKFGKNPEEILVNDDDIKLFWNNLPEDSIICHDDNNNIYKIYRSLKELSNDGFRASRFLSFKNGEKLLGYRWTSYSDWNLFGRIRDFYIKYNIFGINITLTPIRETRIKVPIVRYDSSGNIVKIYKTISDVRSSEPSKLRWERSKSFLGSSWDRLDDFEAKEKGNLEKVIEYLNNHKGIQ